MPSKSCICLHTLSTRLKFICNDGETFSGERPGSKEGDAGPLGHQEGTGESWDWPRTQRGWGRRVMRMERATFPLSFSVLCFCLCPTLMVTQLFVEPNDYKNSMFSFCWGATGHTFWFWWITTESGRLSLAFLLDKFHSLKLWILISSADL